MYSDNFVLHMFQKANQLLAIQKNKRGRTHQKLDYNLKRMLDHLPPELKQMKVEQFMTKFNGDLDVAAEKLAGTSNAGEEEERMYQSPPKNEGKRRNIRKNKGHNE